MSVRSRRGQPLIALAGIMGMWVAARALGPVGDLLDVPLPLPPTVAGRVEPTIEPPPIPAEQTEQAPSRFARAPSPPRTVLASSLASSPIPAMLRTALPPRPIAAPFPAVLPEPPTPLPAQPGPHHAPQPSAQLPFGAVPPEVRARRRWSADGWVLLREASKAGAALVGSGTYGASQAGAVVRYRIAPDSRFDPRAYLRVSATLSGEDEKEAAAGIAVRPIRRLPVDLMVEGRVLRFNGDAKLRPSETRLRPAAMAVIGPPPMPIIAGARAEAYAQAGYVGGEGASAFVDGQLRAVRDVPALAPGKFHLDAGVGAWGGAQKGVKRLDAGPTVALRFPLGKNVFARAGLDWRQRIAGNAEPGSGPVLTLSAGF